MKIADLKPRQGKVDIEMEIVEVGPVREFERGGKTIKVATALAKDDSGKVQLTLWNEEIDKVTAGCKVKITNGYVNEFQGQMQLTAGKFGKLEVL